MVYDPVEYCLEILLRVIWNEKASVYILNTMKTNSHSRFAENPYFNPI